MKKFFYLLFFVFLLLPFGVNAKNINIYVFYGDGCMHCAALERYLDSAYSSDEEVHVYKYEVWYNRQNQKLWQDVQNVKNIEAKGVPYFIIGEKVLQGYNETKVWESTVDNAIKVAKENDYVDEVGPVLGVKTYINNQTENQNNKSKELENNSPNTKISIPIFKDVDLKNVSIPFIAIIIGLVDGFNPCAMWILIFLISMLFGYKNKTKMWILGCTFLFTSAFIYFLFMISFLKVAMFINSIAILKILVSVFALCFGFYNIYRYYKTKDIGCDVVNKDQRKKIIVKIKNIISNNSFLLSIIGIIFLAISVNLIELLCSLGLPVMFTEILAYNNISFPMNIIYIVLYVIFFLLDDLLIFFIAMKTLEIKAISNKYTKYSHLIGGIIMVLIGLLMFLKPEWLMFNF